MRGREGFADAAFRDERLPVTAAATRGPVATRSVVIGDQLTGIQLDTGGEGGDCESTSMTR